MVIYVKNDTTLFKPQLARNLHVDQLSNKAEKIKKKH